MVGSALCGVCLACGNGPWHDAGMKRGRWLSVIGPGILVAATGVGAGDLATASLTGNQLGVAVLWAVVLGAAMKYVLTEGLARWQLATGQSLLEGCVRHLGWPFKILFFAYLLLWSFFVASALMAACGITLYAMVPLFKDPADGKVWFGIAHGLLGLVLVWAGGFKLFERVMAVCIAIMFVAAVVTAFRLSPGIGAIAAGLTIPRIPQLDGEGLSWTVALIGGVGGTLTVLCYGYWIREAGREGPEAVPLTRIDLATGYAMTAIFGISMVIIGSQTVIEGKGAGLIVALAENLDTTLGPVGKWLFLVGVWGAVSSSLLGVWQSVPYLFTDFCLLIRRREDGQRTAVSTQSWLYRGYLVALAIIPMLALPYGFKSLQKAYAIFGAAFMPFLALVLIYLNGSTRLIGAPCKNRLVSNLALAAIVLFFAAAAWMKIARTLGWA